MRQLTLSLFVAAMHEVATYMLHAAAQVEFLLSRVMLLKESIDDSEDLINIALDQRCALER